MRARLGAGTDEPLSDAIRVEPDARPRPLLFRRGPTTGNRLQPAADVRFSRTERLRLELPLPHGATGRAGRFLDRNGQPLQIPVQLGDRTDDDGRTWLTADAQLSALAAGDYLVELAFAAGGTTERILTAIRITR